MNGVTDIDSQVVKQALLSRMAEMPPLLVKAQGQWSADASAVITDSKWLLGYKKVTYEARIVLRPATRSVVFWEQVQESSGGVPPLFTATTEKYATAGKTRSGTISETGANLGDKVLDYKFHYGKVRNAITEESARNGWKVQTVMIKPAAE